MKLLHIADLHIGKRVNEFSMIEDQKHILDQIIKICNEEEPDAVLIAGDVYDKSQPSAEAVELLDEFLTRLIALGQAVILISGNHDSPERLSFGSRILRKNGLHIAGVFDGTLQKVSLEDEHSIVNIYALPYLKPTTVRPYLEQAVESYDEAVCAVIAEADINTWERNILIAHQFVVSGTQRPERSESENLSVGGLDSVDISAFDDFDYVALGHLHRPQRIGRDTVRYAGSPLKYSFSEALYQKSATLLELGIKGELSFRQLPLHPLHDLREIKGPIAELLRIGREESDSVDDYLHIILTDEEEIYDAVGQLRQVYPNLMGLDFENSRSQAFNSEIAAVIDVAEQSPLDLFKAFYLIQNNNELSSKQTQVMEKIFEEAGADI
ncbi:MAG TPA: exonuclease sbcCD subunit D [Clostridiales bacterium]|nr:exonuclease SbcCD subunit D [Clostridia bacterium]HCS75853.1 exonuclease sbcCD subunit D [Clostridiales bacterium]